MGSSVLHRPSQRPSQRRMFLSRAPTAISRSSDARACARALAALRTAKLEAPQEAGLLTEVGDCGSAAGVRDCGLATGRPTADRLLESATADRRLDGHLRIGCWSPQTADWPTGRPTATQLLEPATAGWLQWLKCLCPKGLACGLDWSKRLPRPNGVAKWCRNCFGW